MFRTIFVSFFVSLIVSVWVGFYIHTSIIEEQDTLIQDFYESENAVLVSPHSLRKKIMEKKNDFVLVDLRSEQEYKKEHIVGALNIPAYKTPDKSAYDEEDRIVDAFKKIITENPNKEIIVHCYSSACMTGRKIGKILSHHDIYVKHLAIWWNEWRYSWNLWNHDGETPSKVEDYIESNSNSSQVPVGEDAICSEGEFNC